MLILKRLAILFLAVTLLLSVTPTFALTNGNDLNQGPAMTDVETDDVDLISEEELIVQDNELIDSIPLEKNEQVTLPSKLRENEKRIVTEDNNILTEDDNTVKGEKKEEVKQTIISEEKESVGTSNTTQGVSFSYKKNHLNYSPIEFTYYSSEDLVIVVNYHLDNTYKYWAEQWEPDFSLNIEVTDKNGNNVIERSFEKLMSNVFIIKLNDFDLIDDNIYSIIINANGNSVDCSGTVTLTPEDSIGYSKTCSFNKDSDHIYRSFAFTYIQSKNLYIKVKYEGTLYYDPKEYKNVVVDLIIKDSSGNVVYNYAFGGQMNGSFHINLSTKDLIDGKAYIVLMQQHYDYEGDDCYSGSISLGPAANSVTLPKTLGINYGSKKTIEAKPNPSGTLTIVTWKSSNNKIATVNKNGNVTSKGIGKCRITATTPYGNTSSCSLTVYSAGLKYKSKTIFAGKKITNKLKGVTSGTTWNSSNKAIATVNSKGVITGKKPGKCTITAKHQGKTYRCAVTVKVKLKYNSLTLHSGKTRKNVLKYPTSGVTWKSSNKKVATVDRKGLIKAKEPGKCTITAKYKGKSYKCTVKVVRKLNHTKATMYRNETLKLKLDGTKGKIKWKSSNKKVATVSSSGKVTAKKPGSTTISIKYKGKTYKCKVKVVYRWPNFGAYLYDYNTRYNYFVVKYKNVGTRNVTITSGIKVEDVDYKSFDRKVKLKKKVTIKPGKTKYVRFYVKGSTTWPEVEDFTLFYNFRFDGKTWEGHVWDEESVFERYKKWYSTYWDQDWFDYWY